MIFGVCKDGCKPVHSSFFSFVGQNKTPALGARADCPRRGGRSNNSVWCFQYLYSRKRLIINEGAYKIHSPQESKHDIYVWIVRDVADEITISLGSTLVLLVSSIG